MNTSADQQKIVDEFQGKLNQVRAQLAKTTQESAEFLQIESFIKLLRDNAVPADLGQLEVHSLKELCVNMFTHIKAREGELGVHFFPINRQDQGLLVCNCDEAPFLLDSLLLLLRRQRLGWQVVTHLRLKVRRKNGTLTSLQDAKLEMANESLLIVQSEGSAGTPEMLDKIRQVLKDVLHVASDRGALQKTLEDLQPQAEKVGYGSFWSWLTDENFVPLSYRQLRLTELEDSQGIEMVEGSELGIASDPAHNRLTIPKEYTQCDAHLQACITQKDTLAVTQSGKPSPVWRDELLTSISLRGETSGGQEIIHDIAGLYTQHSRGSSALDIEELRTKVEQALTDLGIAPESYNYRKTKDLLSTFPITELFFLVTHSTP
ncbi:MAG: NAD-glutamate dehydrogenase [Geobacteraceae bacterium]|nr:NAD-glutamate dehydrogenase [Geobacteraceae bacterium]